MPSFGLLGYCIHMVNSYMSRQLAIQITNEEEKRKEGMTGREREGAGRLIQEISRV